MATRVDVKTSHSRKYITFPFEFKGNVNDCKVCLCPGSRGDGEIYTGHGGRRYARLIANVCKYNDEYLKFTFTYYVYEPEWNTKNKRDALYFTKVFYQSVNGARFTSRRAWDNVKETTEQFWDLPNQGEAIYKDFYNSSDPRHNYMPVDLRSYPNENQVRSWLPADKLRFKIDDSGNELKGAGNIGVKGQVGLYITLTKTVRTETKEDDPVNSLIGSKRRKGSCDVISAIPSEIRGTLCHGYDITGEYAAAGYVKDQVLNLDALNEDKHVMKFRIEKFDGLHLHGSSAKELNESREKELSLNLSFGLKGFSFSHEMKKTFKMEHKEKYGYRYNSTQEQYNHESYRLDTPNSPQNLYGYLNQNFLDDLNNKSASQIIQDYGTHVMLGGVLGARLTYDMRHRSSLVEHSEAKTFSTSTSFGFTRGTSQLAKKEEAPKKSPAAEFFDNVNKLLSGNPTTEQLKYIAEITAAMGKGNSGKVSSSGAGNLKISAGVTTSESSFSSSKYEEENTEVVCDGKGGNAYWCKMITHDPLAYDKWLSSINPNTCVWCDYMPGTLVPIYLFVPAGYRNTAQDIKDAMEAYIRSQAIEQEPLYRSVRYFRATLRDGSKSFNFAKENGRNQDPELSTQSNKRTGWKVKLELVNLPNGHIGIAVWYNVAESGFRSGRSEIQFRDIVDVTNGLNRNCAIDPAYRAVWESREFTVVGQHHEWMDVSHLLLNCPYIQVDNANRVRIRIDGSGDDYKNIGFEATFKVPYIYYND